ncbi:nucleotide modification associated domain-containing protein [Anaerococcus nagyae]|uniref:nucleotide modification associated domain-containing protein n=1 Tax=Anaerococcus nagyae TaxID=1755241 RepID=UPI003247E4F0
MDKTDKMAAIMREMLKTYRDKNADYGDSFSKSYKEFGLVAPVVRMSDKMERIKALSKADAKVKDESIKDTLLDLANYAIMTIVEMDIEDDKVKADEEAFKDVVNIRMNNVEKAKKESLNEIMKTLERINGVSIDDKNKPEAKEYTEGDKLNI